MNRVHCLKCDGLYIERAAEVVEVCPHCGNPDMKQTVYLSPEVMEREFAITFAPEDFEEILGCSTEEAERLFDEVLIEEGLGDILQAEAFAMFVRMVRDRMADRSKQAP